MEDKLDNQEISEEAYAHQLVDTINANSKFVVVSLKNNVLIAKAELYVYYNEDESSWEPALKFIFGDGSSVDAETYFSSGQYRDEFGGLIDEINKMINDFNTEYDTNLGGV